MYQDYQMNKSNLCVLLHFLKMNFKNLMMGEIINMGLHILELYLVHLDNFHHQDQLVNINVLIMIQDLGHGML